MKYYTYIFLLFVIFVSCKSNRAYHFNNDLYSLSQGVKIDKISLKDDRKIFIRIMDEYGESKDSSSYSIKDIIKPDYRYEIYFIQKYTSHRLNDYLYLEIITNNSNEIIKWEVVDIYYRKRVKQFKKINGEVTKQGNIPKYSLIKKEKNGKTLIRYKKSKAP